MKLWKLVRCLIRRLESISKDYNRIDERLDALLMDLLALESALSAPSSPDANWHPGQQKPGAGQVPVRTPRRVEGPSLVARLSFFKRPDGRWKFDLDGRSLILSGRLAALLILLAGDEGEVTDELVGWKARELLRASLGSNSGSLLSPQALNNLVYRVRKEIKRQTGLPSSLILQHPFLGLRLALQRPQPSEDVTPIHSGDDAGA